jgi:hypothetical protein
MIMKSKWALFLLICLCALFISACHREAKPSEEQSPSSQSEKPKAQKETPGVPECTKNYTREGNWASGLIYKTWVKYDNVDFSKAVDASLQSLQAYNHRVLFVDRERGTISAELFTWHLGSPYNYPIDVMIAKDKSSVIVNLTVRAHGERWGGVDLCSFYTKLDEIMAREKGTAKPQKAPAAPNKTEAPKQQPSEPSAKGSSGAPLRTAEVIVPSENLREKPQGRIVGKVNNGTRLEILEEQDKWLRVRLEDKKEAWIWKASTKEVPKVPPPAKSK